MIRPDCATRKAGAPSLGLLNVPYSTFPGASVTRGATHSGRPFRRFVTSGCEKCGLTVQPGFWFVNFPPHPLVGLAIHGFLELELEVPDAP